MGHVGGAEDRDAPLIWKLRTEAREELLPLFVSRVAGTWKQHLAKYRRRDQEEELLWVTTSPSILASLLAANPVDARGILLRMFIAGLTIEASVEARCVDVCPV